MRVVFDELTCKELLRTAISGITNKSLQKRLDSGYKTDLFNATMINDDLRLTFFCQGSRVDDSGQPNDYYVTLLILKANKYLNNQVLNSVDISSFQKAIRQAIDTCDIKLHSDDPSFYWQGMWEDLDSLNMSVYPFKGIKGKGIWRNKHAASGGLSNAKIRITKHIADILLSIDTYIYEAAVLMSTVSLAQN